MSRYGLIVFLLQVVFYTFLLAEPSKGQKSLENITVTVEFQQSKLKNVFTRIEKLTDFQFAYQKSEIRDKQSFSISRRNITMANLLREIARETNLQFRRVNEIIHVKGDGAVA
ncbi:MAG: STN domain-containing protein, partial [Cytophagales bacterium]|nr:STN domain-containing protein [Cytophagales bacterium]